MKNLILIFLLLAITNLRVKSQDFDKAKMDKFFAMIEKYEKGMGSLSIFADGKEVYQKSLGFASITDKVSASENTKYRIGSISKTFTATLIMQLVEKQQLSLDTKLSEYFSEVKNADKITIEHLLKHRSGIVNITNQADYLSWMQKPISKENLVKKIVNAGSNFDPDEKMEYSNSGYILLSFIIEKVTKKDFAKVLERFIIKPLKLKNTYYGGKISVKNNEALSYKKEKNWELGTETDMSIPIGAGALVSTPNDLNIFLNNLFNGKIVSKASLTKMQTLQDNYGLGIFSLPFYDKKPFGHTGGIDSFQSNAFYFPQDKVSIAYISNGSVMPVNDIMIGVLSIYFGKDYTLPNFDLPELKSEDLDKYLGVYSSNGFPLKVTITKEKNKLFGQATGQSAFPLALYEEHKFKFDTAKLKLEFIPNDNKMILRQGGREFEFKKE